MTLQIALYRKLVALGITPNVYEEELPQNPTYPATVYSMIDAVPVGRSHDTGVMPFRDERFQIDVFAETVPVAKAAIERYFSELGSFDGVISDGESPETLHDVTIRYEATNPNQSFRDEKALSVVGRSMDFKIFYK